MKRVFKNSKLIIVFFAAIVTIFFIFYIICSKYVFFKNALAMSTVRDCDDIITNCSNNKELSQTILKEGKVEKYEALLYEQQFGSICKLIAGLQDDFTKSNKDINYNDMLRRICERPFGRNFAVFNGSNTRELTDDDRTFLKSKIKIYDAILDAPAPSADNSKSSISIDNCFNWLKHVYDNICKLSMTDLYN